MEHEQILRISELTRLSRERALTQEEQAERAALRQQYLDEFRNNMESTLARVDIREADGTLRPLRRKEDPSDENNAPSGPSASPKEAPKPNV
jgi:uncharacterized protein YnzC (UPF0291/DUF896 family)